MTDTAVRTRQKVSWSRMRALLVLQRRELLRDKRNFWFAFLFPFAILGMFLVIFGAVGSYADGTSATDQVIAMTCLLYTSDAADDTR